MDATIFQDNIQYTRNLLRNIDKDEVTLIHYDKNMTGEFYNNSFKVVTLKKIINNFITGIFRSRSQLKRFDLIHIPDFRFYHVPIILFTKAKIVLTIHEHEKCIPVWYKKPNEWIGVNIRRLTLSLIKSKIDMYIAISEFLKERCVAEIGISEEKIKVIYLAGSESFHPHLPSSIDKYILSDTPSSELIEVYNNAVKRGINEKLLIFSKREHWDVRKANILIEEYGLKKVFFLGYVTDDRLCKLYSNARLYIRFPVVDAFEIQILNAMMSGCPVLSTKVGSVPEIAGDAAVLDKDGEIDLLGRDIYAMIKHREFRDELIEHGFSHSKRFSWKKTGKETMDLYIALLNKRD